MIGDSLRAYGVSVSAAATSSTSATAATFATAPAPSASTSAATSVFGPMAGSAARAVFNSGAPIHSSGAALASATQTASATSSAQPRDSDLQEFTRALKDACDDIIQTAGAQSAPQKAPTTQSDTQRHAASSDPGSWAKAQVVRHSVNGYINEAPFTLEEFAKQMETASFTDFEWLVSRLALAEAAAGDVGAPVRACALIYAAGRAVASRPDKWEEAYRRRIVKACTGVSRLSDTTTFDELLVSFCKDLAPNVLPSKALTAAQKVSTSAKANSSTRSAKSSDSSKASGKFKCPRCTSNSHDSSDCWWTNRELATMSNPKFAAWVKRSPANAVEAWRAFGVKSGADSPAPAASK